MRQYLKVLLPLLLGLIMVNIANADLAKIQRKTAILDVQPAVIVKGNQAIVVIQPYQSTEYQLVISDQQGNLVIQEDLGTLSEPFSKSYSFSKGGVYQVLLKAKTDAGWQVVAYQSINHLTGFWEEYEATVQQLEAIEKASDTSAELKRAAWGCLALAEDIAERFKDKNPVGFSGQFNRLKDYAEQLANGTNPFADQTGYQLRGYRSDLNDQIQLYSLYVPENYDDSQEWPLVIMLHGAWSNHHLALRRVMGKSNQIAENDDQAKRVMPDLPDVPYLVVAPNGYETMSYAGFAEEDVFRVLNEVNQLFNVDTNRIYLTGLSMGGGGTGRIGLRYPDVFAAIAPVCGYFEAEVRPDGNPSPKPWQQMKEAFSSLALAENAMHLPVKLMHGEDDSTVPVQHSKNLHQRLQELGYESEIELYPNVGHAAWENAYKDARIFEWFAQYERNPYPADVALKTGNPNGASTYWVSIDEQQSIRQLSKLEAHAEPGLVEVKTENVERLTLTFPHDFFYQRDSIKIMIDGQFVIEGGYQQDKHSFVIQDGTWQHTNTAYESRLLPGQYGLYQAKMGRHVYVYSDSSSAAATKMTRHLATLKSTPQDIHDVQWSLIAENELTETIIENNNLILFTDKAADIYKKILTESEVFATMNQFEMQKHLSDEDSQALSFIIPNPYNTNRYIQVNVAAEDQLGWLQPFAVHQPFLDELVFPDFVQWNQNGAIVAMGLCEKNWKIHEIHELDRPITLD